MRPKINVSFFTQSMQKLHIIPLSIFSTQQNNWLRKSDPYLRLIVCLW